jgi:hypothetical protein
MTQFRSPSFSTRRDSFVASSNPSASLIPYSHSEHSALHRPIFVTITISQIVKTLMLYFAEICCRFAFYQQHSVVHSTVSYHFVISTCAPLLHSFGCTYASDEPAGFAVLQRTYSFFFFNILDRASAPHGVSQMPMGKLLILCHCSKANPANSLFSV